MTTNITTRHREAFDALTPGQYSNFALFSCFVNGEPAAAIIAVDDRGAAGQSAAAVRQRHARHDADRP